jgi:hypothetical protein
MRLTEPGKQALVHPRIDRVHRLQEKDEAIARSIEEEKQQ